MILHLVCHYLQVVGYAGDKYTALANKKLWAEARVNFDLFPRPKGRGYFSHKSIIFF